MCWNPLNSISTLCILSHSLYLHKVWTKPFHPTLSSLCWYSGNVCSTPPIPTPTIFYPSIPLFLGSLDDLSIHKSQSSTVLRRSLSSMTARSQGDSVAIVFPSLLFLWRITIWAYDNIKHHCTYLPKEIMFVCVWLMSNH